MSQLPRVRFSRWTIGSVSVRLLGAVVCLLWPGVMSKCWSEDLDRLWKVELKRMKQSIAAGEYRDALRICGTFEREVADAKGKLNVNELRDHAVLIRQMSILSCLARATCEKYCGNYSASVSRLERAESLIKDQKRIVGSAYRNALAAWQRAVARQEFAEEVTHDWLAARYNRWLAEKIRPQLNALEDVVFQCESDLILAYDARATMLVDESMPIGEGSERTLRKAEDYFGKAQDVREVNFHNVATSFSMHGDQLATFLRNYGRLYLKQAEVKKQFPEAFGTSTRDDLLDRASFYFGEATRRFSKWDRMIREFQTLTHEGSITNANRAILHKLKEMNKSEKEAEEFLNDFQLICVGYADLCFNRAEMHLVKAGDLADAGDATGAADELAECEQLLLNGADMLSLVSPKADHPYLVICYSELATAAALGVAYRGKEPGDDEEMKDYLSLAEEIMRKRELSAETVQGRYLEEAKRLCDGVAKVAP
jgi:hypothetical protein